MREEDEIALVAIIGLFTLLLFAFLAGIAGDVANQLLAPVPGIAGPLGAATSLMVFVFLLMKTGDILFG